MKSGLAASRVDAHGDCFAIKFPGSFLEALEAAYRCLAWETLQLCRAPRGDHGILPAPRQNSASATEDK